MNRDHFVAGDWGTSRLRLSLCLGERILATRQGPGIGALREPADEALRPLLAGWREAYGPLPLVLCGVVGSRNGWRETLFEARGEAVVIGNGTLNERYAHAMRREGIAASCLDGEQCALAGLRTLCRP